MVKVGHNGPEETTYIKQGVGLHIEVITVNWWWERWGKTSDQTLSTLFLKALTEGAVTTEAESLFQYFTTLTENADTLLWRWLAP